MSFWKLKIFTLVFLISSNFINSLHAGSFYSSKGIGVVHYFISGRSVGMGGVGLALTDNLTVNYMNPATLIAIPITHISANFLHEAVDLKGKSMDGFISDTNVAGVQFVIPIKQNVAVISLGLNPYTNIEYTFSSDGFEGEKKFTERISGEGGVNNAFFSFAFRPIKNFSLGITGIFHFGRIRNIWQVNFDPTGLEFFDTKDEVSRNFTAGNFRVGVLYKIFPAFSIAGVFTPPVTLDANKKVSNNFGQFSDFPDTDLEIPLAFGVGTAFYLGKKLIAGVDFYFQKWSEFNRDGVVNDSKRIGFGFEYGARGSQFTSYFSKMTVRGGIFYRDLGIEDPIGNKVTELFGSFGLGLPIKWRAARIDLGLEVGRRGSLESNPIKETIVRISGSITVGERWFYRGGRK